MEREEGEIGNSGEYTDHYREQQVEDQMKEKAVTFYVSNIHPQISDGELWTECRNYGQIVDAYIAKKLDKKGKRFGFLRFVKITDADKMVKALNQLTFYGWRIRANVARFVKIVKKEKINKGSRWIPKEHKVNSKPVPKNNSFLKNGTTWAGVVAGEKIQQQEDNGLTFANESMAYRNWRGKSVLGELQKVEHLRVIKRMRQQLGLRNDQVRYIGGVNVLIVYDSEEDMKASISKDEEAWVYWFNSRKIWNGEDIPFQRIAWLKIRGVPM
ncbi:putative RNA recognition motif domain, nucleotide-binding alpha-beta plait domain superfamily [Helianthus annuus]|nr:putative RNA recognition motif domain, nucleotide-binding alpha-beta plait domain superfamily [Helianthus annuus]